MAKLIFCDIDGTLLDGSRNMNQISDKTRYAFKQLLKDNYVFIASGRCKGLLDKELLSLGLSGYVLCNGAYVEYDNKKIFSKCFDKDTLDKIKDITEKYNGFVIYETLNEMFVESLENETLVAFLGRWGKTVNGLKPGVDMNKDYHIIMNGFINEESKLKAGEELKEYVDLAPHSSFSSYDINIKGINKGSGVIEAIKYLNVDINDTYCFADGINDLEMLQIVKHPVVMKNAINELKTYEFEETDDVLDDGFYNYLVSNKLIKPL